MASAPDAEYYRLRTEWLRFKGHLYDSLTALPALPAVVENVRRILESRGGADVVYLDLGRSGRHETKLGWAVYDEAVKLFASHLVALRDVGALGSEDILCLHTVRSDRFIVFLAGRSGDGEGTRARTQKLLAAVKTRLEQSPPGNPLRQMHVATGCARIGLDPMIRSERLIQQAVADAMMMSLVEKEGIEASRRDELARMIAEGGVRAVFHPIVRLSTREVVGHEALTRPLTGTAFDSVEELFSFAESTDLIVEFERLCRATAIRSVARVPGRGLLFLNASARAVEDPEWGSGVTERQLAEAGLSPHDVVIEITERVAITRHDAFGAALRLFKERGYRVAVDDMGAGYSSLTALASIEPDFLKFDTSLVREIDRSSIKRSLLDSLRSLAEKIGARVIAEGIERPEELETLKGLGIELGQGFYFHKEG